MKLLFLYIRKFGRLENVQFNFDGNWLFTYDYENGRQMRVQYCEKIPSRFFSKGGVVESVSALIGENGSGKTSVARLLCQAWKSKPADFRNPAYLAVAMVQGRIRQFGYHSANWSKEDLGMLPNDVRQLIDEKPKQKDVLFSKERPIVYYSPFYTTERGLRDEHNEIFYDISTSGLLFKDTRPILFGSREMTKEVRVEDVFRSAERMRVLVFLSAVWKWIGKKKERRNAFPMVLPGKIELSVGEKWAGEYRADFMHPFMPIEDLEADGDEGLLRSVNHALKNYGVFGKAFVHSVVWCVSKLGGTERAAWTIVDALVKTERSWLSTEGYRMSIDYDSLEQAWVDALDDLPRARGDLKRIRSSTIGFLLALLKCWRRRSRPTGLPNALSALLNDGLSESFSQMMTNYQALVVQGMPDFFVARYDPVMSSGEMAFLSLFGRLYECCTKMLPDSEPTIFLDEVETTLHPAWQRKLVVLLVWFFETLFSGMKCHLLFASHSPMLLSDIPHGNVTIMRDFEPKHCPAKTFGASVFDLYRMAFNLEDGVFGALARKHLDDLLDKADRGRLEDRERLIARLFGNELIRRHFMGCRHEADPASRGE